MKEIKTLRAERDRESVRRMKESICRSGETEKGKNEIRRVPDYLMSNMKFKKKMMWSFLRGRKQIMA